MKKWTEKDLNYLNLCYDNLDLSIEHMAFTLNRSIASIVWKAGKLGLNRRNLIKRKSKAEYDKKYKQKNRKEISKRIKERKELFKLELISLLGSKCIICGEKRHMCLDFHHKNKKTKKFAISTGLSAKSKKDVIEEAKKCELLCANCYREKHYNENNAAIV